MCMTHEGSGLSDAELLSRSRAEPDLFGLFYDRHSDAILSYCYRRTGCPTTAADLTAEVFAAAYAKRLAFRDTGTPARAWLYGIAKRQLGTFVRRRRVADRWRRRFGLTSLETTADELERIETLVDLEPVRGALRDALGTLPQQRALWLRVIEDRSYRDIATELGCTEGAARVRVSRGLTRLAEILEAP